MKVVRSVGTRKQQERKGEGRGEVEGKGTGKVIGQSEGNGLGIDD